MNKGLRKASIASFPEEQNFQLVDQKKEAQEEPYDTGNNDDEIELTTPADETKYSVELQCHSHPNRINEQG